MGTACHVRGAKRVLEAAERKLKIKAGETTEDMEFTLETVNCLGACALAPLVVVNEKNHAKVNSNKINQVIDGCKSEAAAEEKEAS
jgi:NADH-quinone oxidoreductase subunit E